MAKEPQAAEEAVNVVEDPQVNVIDVRFNRTIKGVNHYVVTDELSFPNARGRAPVRRERGMSESQLVALGIDPPKES